MHKLLALSFGLMLGLSALTSVEAVAGNRYYCPPAGYQQPVFISPSPVFYREPEWQRSRETGGYYRWNDYHENRGTFYGEKSWKTGSYESNRGWGHYYEDKGEEHFRKPGYGSSNPVFP